MLPLSLNLLTAAGFEYDAIEQTWVVPVPLPPLVTVECHEGDGNIMDALLDVHAILDANDCTYNILAVYIAYEATETLIKQEPPDVSYVGIGLALASVIVMPLLARAKRKVAARLGSRALHADSRQTDICSYLSAILLLGLGANALGGWWWADPVAGLLMVPIIGKEGVDVLRGESCTCHTE